MSKIRFLQSPDILYDLKLDILIWGQLVQLSGNNIPELDNYDFDVIEIKNIIDENENEIQEEIILEYYYNYNIIYDKGEKYIQLTNDNNVYKDYLLYDEFGYVTSSLVSTMDEIVHGHKYQEGQGKKYYQPDLVLFDENGAPLYKIIQNEVYQVSEQERKEIAINIYSKTLVELKEKKIKECADTCQKQITSGIDYKDKHYSYELSDQNNISNTVQLATQTGLEMPYHADGESCELYSKEDLIAIYISQEANLTHHTTYNNQLKLFINSLQTKEEVEAVQYGQPLVGQYLETYNQVMSQTQTIIDAFLNK